MKRFLWVLIFLFLSSSSFADIHDFQKMTWNMQGSGRGAKWATGVLQLINQAMAQGGDFVIAIQEGGAGPGSNGPGGVFVPNNSGISEMPEPGTPGATPLTVDGPWPNGAYPRVVEFQWVLPRSGNRVYVYGVYSDFRSTSGNPAGSVNSFIVSNQPADRLVLLHHRDYTPTSNNSVRPNFGMQIGNSYFFTVHSISGQGAGEVDSSYRLEQIEEFVSRQGPVADWAAMGDFNAEPAAVVLRNSANPRLDDVQVSFTGQPTTTSGRSELDYMFYRESVVGAFLAAAMAVAALVPMQNSDHLPVRFW